MSRRKKRNARIHVEKSRPGQAGAADRFEEAQAHENAGRTEEAEAGYRRILRREPQNAQVLFHLGGLLVRAGRPAEALSVLERAAAAAPEVPVVHLNLGNLYYLSGRLQEALGAFHRAREMAPQSPEVHAGLASVHHRLGQPEGAILALRQAVALAPDRADLVTNLAGALHRQERTGEAVTVLEEAVSRIPDNGSLSHLLASFSGRATDTAPVGFVQETFDRLSTDFDRHLVDDLGYRTPEALRDLVEAETGKTREFSRMADLGCGTGLSGQAFRTLARRITGIDLSEKMLERAREKEIYHELVCSDIVEALDGQEEAFDLFVAADVMVYIGDAAPLFRAVHGRGEPGALFAFSTESAPEEAEWVLQTTSRYAHSRAYIRRLCREVGFEILVCRNDRIRKEKGEWITGDLFLVRRNQANGRGPRVRDRDG